MLEPIDFLWSGTSLRRGKRVDLYIGNSEANSLLRRACGIEFIEAAVCIFWKIVGVYSLDIWIGIDGSKMGPSGLPTRKVNPPF